MWHYVVQLKELRNCCVSLWLYPRYRAIWSELINVASPLGQLAGLECPAKAAMPLLGSYRTSEVSYVVLHAVASYSLGMLLHAS